MIDFAGMGGTVSLMAWLLVTALVFISIDILSFALNLKGWRRFAGTFFLGYSQILVTEFSLGLLGVLNQSWLALLNVAITGTVLAYLYKKFGVGILLKYKVRLNLSWRHFQKLIKEDIFWAILLSISAMIVLWIIFLGGIFPATDFDGNSYHLTYIGNILQTQSIHDLPTSLGWLTGYPKGGEFVQMWNMLIPRNDVFVELAQIPFLLLGVYALYAISIRMGASEANARFSSLLFLFIPIVLNQLKTTYVDVMLCSLFFSAIALTLQKKLSRLDLIILGIVYSLLISVKFTGFLFVAATVPFLIWNIYSNLSRTRRKKITSYFSPLVLVFLPTLFGFYWYIKNYVIYGSPLYPFGLKIAGLSVFPGKTFQEFADSATGTLSYLPHGTLERIWFTWTEQKDWFGCFYNYDTNFTGFGPLWFALLLPSVAVATYLAVKSRNVLFGLVSALVLVVFSIYPNNYYSRYTMFILLIGVVSFAIVLTKLNTQVANLTKLLAITLSVVVIYSNFTFCNFSAETLKQQLKVGPEGRSVGTAFSNAFGPAHAYIRSQLKSGDVIAYSSAPYFIYPLWRSDFSNKVIYIPAKNQEEWLRRTNDLKVNYVFATIGSKEQQWLSTQRTKSIYKDGQYEIYKLR